MSALLDIGTSLVRTRRALGIPQRELAATLGTTQQQIARWEASGYRTASLERVAAAAEALGVALPGGPIAAEAGATYGATAAAATAPVRDLGEIATRLRGHARDLRDTYGFDRLGVFGSFATGGQGPSSDVDLLVETKSPGGIRFVEAVLFLEELLGRHVDLVRPGLIKPELAERVTREVIYVWEA